MTMPDASSRDSEAIKVPENAGFNNGAGALVALEARNTGLTDDLMGLAAEIRDTQLRIARSEGFIEGLAAGKEIFEDFARAVAPGAKPELQPSVRKWWWF